MDLQRVTIEFVNSQNEEQLYLIDRTDISEAFVDTVDTILQLTQYGVEHKCIGHTYAIKYDQKYIGIVLLGEAIEWETDPEEMKYEPFYRLMGFIIDKSFRDSGIGSFVLEEIIAQCYNEFGVRPIALGVHKDNLRAESFYKRHGFEKKDSMEGDDYYYIRYPQY